MYSKQEKQQKYLQLYQLFVSKGFKNVTVCDAPTFMHNNIPYKVQPYKIDTSLDKWLMDRQAAKEIIIFPEHTQDGYITGNILHDGFVYAVIIP